MRKKYILFIFICLLLVCVLTGCGNQDFQNNSQNTVSGTQLSENINMQQEENRVVNILQNANEQKTPIEKEISSYTTVIKDNSAGRLTNIRLTCSALNGTVIEPGQIFSFCDTVGNPTVERGYQEATIIINHQTEKGIGGGNCQVSSTLYNAVLAISSLVVTERHEHGKDVSYVPEGKDAAVSYGSLDLKFRNDTGLPIRIDASSDDKSITTRLVQLEK